MLSRLGKWSLVLALAGSIGLHWMLLQSVAWVGMTIAYSQKATLGEALAKTFDGNHPCCLCKEIAKGKQTERNAQARLELKKLEFSHTPARYVFCAPLLFWNTFPPEPAAKLSAADCPTPPPKQALA